jgi:hypothetical protein
MRGRDAAEANRGLEGIDAKDRLRVSGSAFGMQLTAFFSWLFWWMNRKHRQAKQHKEPKKQRRNQESPGRFFAMAEVKHYFRVLSPFKGVHSYIGRTSTVA